MSREAAFLTALRGLATHPAARGLADDAAVLEIGGATLILTHDMLVEGVHYLSGDPPADVAWKLVAVNVSDLAAKGARPVGALLGYSLSDASAWDREFLEGLQAALESFQLPLLGGDTVSARAGAPRTLALTAIGEAPAPVPSRSGARAGDQLWVSGAIGDAGVGLRVALGELAGPEALVARYRRPQPRLSLGQALAPLVGAMMDVSDGLLIDAARMAGASTLALEIELRDVPLSTEFIAAAGEDRQARIDACIAGDDYELLFAAPPEREGEIRAMAASLSIPLTPIGRFSEGADLSVTDRGETLPLPPRLGYEHGGAG
ncbi:MAG TPA: thiamine-phosphate kinase [Allosphingosinicella sp.]